MNRIKEARRNHLQPKPSLGAEGRGEKVEMATSTRVFGLNSGSLAPATSTGKAIQKLQQGMTVGMKSQKLQVDLSNVTAASPLCAPFPDTSNDGSPSRQRATDSSNHKTCLHFNEGAKTPIRGIYKKKKAVGFEITVRVRDIPRKTDEQLQKVWYSHEEQDQIMVQAQKVVKLCRRSKMSEDDFEDEHLESTLGLDHFLNKALFKRLSQERKDVIDAVILLQEEMSAIGRPIDHDLLASACSNLSFPARERAHLVGLGYSQLSAYVRGQSDQRSSHERGGRDHDLCLPSLLALQQRGLT